MARRYIKEAKPAEQLGLGLDCTAIYIRVSTKEQAEEGHSLDAQKTKLLAYCQANEWEVQEQHIYIDAGKSGTTTDRPDYQRMMKDAQERKIGRIAAIKLDRIARNLGDLIAMAKDLSDWGVSLALVHEKIDTSSSSGKLFFHVMGAIAEFEASTIRERTESGRIQNASEGGYNGSRCPLGYTYANSRFDINERAETVRNIFSWFNDGASMNAIVRRLNESSVPTATGKGSWVVHGIKHILGNGAYAGIAQWNGIETAGSYPPIIDSATYDVAQERLRSMSRGKRVDLISEV